ncbi:hypothetical protein NXT01_06355 [Corynebacterium sp. ES2775-CONJ]|nr:hypothetical protein [Corynebacterium sp. ES2775-CONJ]
MNGDKMPFPDIDSNTFTALLDILYTDQYGDWEGANQKKLDELNDQLYEELDPQREAEAELKQVKGYIHSLQGEIDKVNEDIELAREKIAHLKIKKSRLRTEFNLAKRAMRGSRYEAELKTAGKMSTFVNTGLTIWHSSKAQEIEEAINSIEYSLVDLKNAIERMRAQRTDLKEDLREAKKECTVAKREAAKVPLSARTLDKEIAKFVDEWKSQRRAYREDLRQLIEQRLDSRLDQRQQIGQLEGFIDDYDELKLSWQHIWQQKLAKIEEAYNLPALIKAEEAGESLAARAEQNEIEVTSAYQDLRSEKAELEDILAQAENKEMDLRSAFFGNRLGVPAAIATVILGIFVVLIGPWSLTLTALVVILGVALLVLVAASLITAVVVKNAADRALQQLREESRAELKNVVAKLDMVDAQLGEAKELTVEAQTEKYAAVKSLRAAREKVEREVRTTYGIPYPERRTPNFPVEADKKQLEICLDQIRSDFFGQVLNDINEPLSVDYSTFTPNANSVSQTPLAQDAFNEWVGANAHYPWWTA